MRLYVSCLLFAALQLTLIPICSHSAANTKDLTSWQKEIEKIVNTSTAAGDISVKLGIDPDCNPLSQDEILCQWDDYHLETNFPVKVFCSLYVNPSRTKVKWDAQDSCRIYSSLSLSSSSKDNAENLATRRREIEKIVDASTSAGNLSMRLGIAPDCNPLIPDQPLDQILCQWYDYHAKGATISVFCFMLLNKSRTEAIWNAQDQCRIYAPLPPEPKPK
jgi:hypothetical protein